jgi:glycosyltransferase involved in cell wall biosynthesis/rhamnogalacturonyl hydrolase YesR
MVSFSTHPDDPRPRRAAEALLKEGMTVELICLEGGKGPRGGETDGIHAIRIPINHSRGGWLSYLYRYSAFILVSASILAVRSLRRRYDLIHVHNMPDILVLSAVVPKALGAKVVLDLHDPMPELMTTIFGLGENSLGVRVMKWLEKWSMARADLVLTVNTACRNIFASRSCPPDKLGVVMNCPDEGIFPFRQARPRASAGAPFVIMYHGSLVERNGLDLAVEAFARVREAVPGAELRIYGARTPFLEQVLAAAEKKDLRNCVSYLGPKRLEELVAEIESCDVGIIPNQRNAFTDINTPTRILEYLALGKPVIAPRTRGIQDYFGPGSLFFFEAGDAEDLGRQIRYVFDHPKESWEAAERGQQVYLAHTWSEERRTLVNLVKGLLGGGEEMAREGAGVAAHDAAQGSGTRRATGPDEIRRALEGVLQWVEERDYRGYEPFDGLSSRVRPLALGNLLGERLLMQAVRQCPFNLRPLLGIGAKDSTKGRGYMAWGYTILYKATGEERHLDKAARCLDWLDKNRTARFQNHSWSNHYDFVSRGGSYTSDDPIIVWTSLIGHAYIEAFETTGEERYLRIAESAGRWILELPRERTDCGDCLSYLADRQSSIHNANMLGAGFLARTAKHTGNGKFLDVARSAMVYSCSRQLPDGSWWYGEQPNNRWIDNFHTGYNLDSLDDYLAATGDREFQAHLEKGLAFYKAHFFEDSGRPKYYSTRTYPVDIQCAAQSIDTLTRFAGRDPECLGLAEKVAAWTIRNMQDPKGYFHYRQYPLLTAKTPMLHWGQATMFKALAQLLLHWQRAASPQGPPTEVESRRIGTFPGR